MKIIQVDVEDGRGIISVAVQDVFDEARLIAFIRQAWAAIEEKEEREMEILS